MISPQVNGAFPVDLYPAPLGDTTKSADVERAREHVPPDHVREDREAVAPLRALDLAREQLARRQSYPNRNGRPPT